MQLCLLIWSFGYLILNPNLDLKSISTANKCLMTAIFLKDLLLKYLQPHFEIFVLTVSCQTKKTGFG